MIRRLGALEPWIALEAAEERGSRFPFTPLRAVVRRRLEAVAVTGSFGAWTPITVHLNGAISARNRTSPYKGGMFAAYPGDIVFSKIDARNGAIGVLQETIAKAVVTSEFPVFVPEPDRLDGEFVKLVLRTGSFLAALHAKASGTSGRKRITPETFEGLRVPLPPLSEQRALVAAHRAGMDRAAELEGEADETETQAMADFELALGFTPPAPLPDRPVFVASFKDLDRWSHECILRRAVEGDTAKTSSYPTVQLRDVIADLVVGWSPRCLNRPAHGNEWGVLKLSAVTSGRLKPSENKSLPSSAERRPELEVRRGDVLITRGSGVTRLVGATTFVADEPPGKLMISDLIFRVISKEVSEISPAFLAATLATTDLRNQIEGRRTGAAPMMQKITKSALMALRLPLPPENEQTAMTTALAESRAKAVSVREKARRMRTGAWEDFEAAVYATEEGKSNSGH